jgi:hypothetical protein
VRRRRGRCGRPRLEEPDRSAEAAAVNRRSLKATSTASGAGNTRGRRREPCLELALRGVASTNPVSIDPTANFRLTNSGRRKARLVFGPMITALSSSFLIAASVWRCRRER